MKWWSLFGIMRMLTERRQFTSQVVVKPLGRTFKRSLFLYPLDLGNSNSLNLEIAAMKTAQYNVHRFGIFFADSPRHADLFLLLGDLLPALEDALDTTLQQAPRPFGALWIRESEAVATRDSSGKLEQEVEGHVTRAGGTLIAQIEKLEGPEEIIGVLRAAMSGRLA